MTCASKLDLIGARLMSRESFIADHASRCQASPCKKYDKKKLNYGGYHSLEYSRRKCAKNLWRRYHDQRRVARG